MGKIIGAIVFGLIAIACFVGSFQGKRIFI